MLLEFLMFEDKLFQSLIALKVKRCLPQLVLTLGR